MTKEEWKKSIVKACKKAGTYQPFFDASIDTFEKLLERIT